MSALLAVTFLVSLAGCEAVVGSDGGSRRFVEIAAGMNHACALADDGRVFCWGNNHLGQLGDGTTADSPTPVAVSSSERFKRLDAVSLTTCGLTTVGATFCWGRVGSIAPSTRSRSESAFPIAVATGERFDDLTLSFRAACGLRDDGVALCWGQPSDGVPIPVDSAPPIVRSPRPVPGLRFESLSASLHEICGVAPGGSAWCWGTGARSGEDLMPVPVLPGLSFRSAWFGYESACGVTSEGPTVCWGDNRRGSLGVGDTVSSADPRTVAVGDDVRFGKGTRTSVIASPCVIDRDGRAYCWGADHEGMSGSTVPSSTCVATSGFGNPVPCQLDPVEVVGGHRFEKLALGAAFTCGVTDDARVLCWGSNRYGQLGDGTYDASPVPVEVRFP